MNRPQFPGNALFQYVFSRCIYPARFYHKLCIGTNRQDSFLNSWQLALPNYLKVKKAFKGLSNSDMKNESYCLNIGKLLEKCSARFKFHFFQLIRIQCKLKMDPIQPSKPDRIHASIKKSCIKTGPDQTWECLY